MTKWFIDDKLNMKFTNNKPQEGFEMIDYKLGEVEMKFADLIWGNEPIFSGELVKLAADSLVWKKPTT